MNLFRQAGGAALLRLVGVLAGITLTVFLARMLGRGGLGVYFLSLALVTFASGVGRLGLDGVILRHTAAHVALGQWSQAGSLHKKGLRLVVLASALTTLVVLLSADLLAGAIFGKPQLASSIRWLSFAITPFSVLYFNGQVMRDLKRIMPGILVQNVLVATVGLLTALLLVSRWGLPGALWSYLIATVAVFSISSLVLRGSWHTKPNVTAPPSRALLGDSMPLLAVAVLQSLMQLTSTMTLKVFGNSEDVGVFSVVNRTVQAPAFLLAPVNAAAGPIIAELHRKEDLRGLERTAGSQSWPWQSPPIHFSLFSS